MIPVPVRFRSAALFILINVNNCPLLKCITSERTDSINNTAADCVHEYKAWDADITGFRAFSITADMNYTDRTANGLLHSVVKQV